MATGSMEKEYFEGIKAKLEAKLLPRDGNGCRKWQFGPKSSTTDNYARMRIKLPDGRNGNIASHRLMYMCKMNTMSLDKTQEVSHLCHIKSCCEISHLSLELHSINASRNKCFIERKCSSLHGGYPDCFI